jgi:transcriptional regulator with GAF, ATPase, and Fis domain
MIDHQQEEINQYKRRLENEAYFSQPVTLTAYHYNELVGSSPRMKEAFHLASQVAGTNSSVLILGETGTGKELLARAIHNNSARKDKVMVKVNCATLPANLIESELFGHERGSFTGAVDKRIGKFEMADKSTIFLDEIGELSLSLQAKLLRALQEKEIERIGGKATIKTDIRIIAATNRDLIKAVQEGSFRSDLYFRLNVFPITLPALRERKEDIPTLANHFAAKYSKKLNSGISYFTSTAMKQLMAYNWPGNVRELEHLVQRSILLSKGKKVSHLLLQGMNSGDVDQPLLNRDVKTIDEVERAHILSVLKMVNGKVSGIGGAAEILKIPATTLSSKMIRLKIKKGIS